MTFNTMPQIVAAGMYNAQVVFKNKSLSPNRKTTLFELELSIGEGGISYIDDNVHQITEKTVICARPGQMRHTRLPFKCYYIHMIVEGGTVYDTLISLPNFIELSNSDEIKDIFISISECYDSKAPEDEIMLQSLTLKLIFLLSKYAINTKRRSPKRNNHDVIVKTVEYISSNLTADLSLDALSKSFSFAPIYFHKLFKASTGKNLREYVEEQRIKKAIELLLSTELTLTEIAYFCGFSSQSYFSYAFKKKMKCTPREYVKLVHLKYESTF